MWSLTQLGMKLSLTLQASLYMNPTLVSLSP